MPSIIPAAPPMPLGGANVEKERETVPWPESAVGLNSRELRAALTEFVGVGEPKIAGETWTVEAEPGGCSDWARVYTIRFVRGRVASVDVDRRYTGKHCM